MAVSEIPLAPVASQTLVVQLGEQSCRLVVRQRRTGLFVDLYTPQDVPVVLGVKALDRLGLVRGDYLGFIGQLFFVDTQGVADPVYSGLGSRWLFLWDSAA